MNNTFKITSVMLGILLFLTACGSESSDAKKVEVKTVEPVVKKVMSTDATKATTTKVAAKSDEATDKPEFIEGVHYFKISPQMQTDTIDGKVEVVELMWLGCPHCFHFEPTVDKYKENHPNYVEFKQVPAMLNPSWSEDAKTYILAEVLDPKGEKDLVTKIFKAIHVQRRRLHDPSKVKRFLVELGYTEDEIQVAKLSMLYRTKVNRAKEISTSSQATSVPTLIINGKYRTSPYAAGSEEKVMKIIDMLTRREKK